MTNLFLAVFSGVLYGLAFPSFNFHFLAWFALVPLLLVRNRNFRYGWICGFVANLIVFFWLWKTFYAAGISFVTTVPVWIALAAVLGLYFGIFNFLIGQCPDRIFRPWVAGIVWGLLELIRTHILTGFPWALLAHTQVDNLPILQMAAVGGEFLIGFLLIVSNCLLASLILNKSKKTFIHFGVFALMLGLMFVWGGRRINRIDEKTNASPKFRVALLQGNIDQYQKWDDVYEAGIRERYESLIKEALNSNPDLIIWPESALPGWFPNDASCTTWVRDVVRQSKKPHLFGAVSARDGGEYNSAFLMAPNGEILGSYDKHHLVPFGEYIPFGGVFKRWIPYLGQLGTFDAGEGGKIFRVDDVRLAPNICYEAIFSSLVHRTVVGGADVIVNITNDGWFLDTAAPEQHYNANVFRAVENGMPVIRSANTGISALIDPAGRQFARSPLLVSGVYTVDVPLVSESPFFSLLYSRLCHAN